MERISWRNFAFIYFLVFSFYPGNTNGDDDWRLDEDTKGWIDPHSMLEPEAVRKTAVAEREAVLEICEKAENDCSVIEKSLTVCGDQVAKLKKDLEKQKELNKRSETTADKEQPFFEQYLRHILGLFTKVQDGMNVGHYEATIALSQLNYGYLSTYVTNPNASVQEVHSILLKLITDVRWIIEDVGFNDFNAGSDKSLAAQFRYCLNVAGAVAVVMVALLQVVTLLRRVRMSLSRFVFLLFVTTILTSFVISVPWTWWHLYKKKVAERMATMSRQPPDCANQMNSLWKMFKSYFYIESDECQKYYEQLEIDPLWEVPPTQAVAVTFIRFFLEPAKHIGQAIREFMMSAFEGLPILLWLPVYAFIILLFILVLFCLGRYRISMPFLSIEPARSDGDHQMAALQDRVQQLQLENQELRRAPALPDARGNAADDRGDRRRTPPLQVEEPPTTARVQDVQRHDADTSDTENKRVIPLTPPQRTLENVSTDSESVDQPSSLCELALASAAKTTQPARDDITQLVENIVELTPENPSTAANAEPRAECKSVGENDEEQFEKKGEDLQSYVMIETISLIEDINLDENLLRENKTSATDANQAARVTDFVKT